MYVIADMIAIVVFVCVDCCTDVKAQTKCQISWNWSRMLKRKEKYMYIYTDVLALSGENNWVS